MTRRVPLTYAHLQRDCQVTMSNLSYLLPLSQFMSDLRKLHLLLLYRHLYLTKFYLCHIALISIQPFYRYAYELEMLTF